MIFVAIGGSGSEYLSVALKAHYRPDRAFGLDRQGNWSLTTLYDFPTQNQRNDFKKRSKGYSLDLNKNILDNMKDYIDFIEKNNIDVLFQGFLSRISGDTINSKLDYNHICLVRHPLHAYVSLVYNRHPNITKKYDKGAEDIECIRYFSDMWNSVIGDHKSYIRYEYAYDDAVKLNLSSKYINILMGLYSSKRNYGVLSEEGEKKLKDLVKENFESIYNEWKI